MALGPSSAPDRTLLGRLWWSVAQRPLRLLGLGSLLALLLLALLVTSSPPSPALLLLALFAVALQLLAAILMEFMPSWSARSPVHYLRYGGTFLFGVGGTALLLPAALNGASPWLSLPLFAIAWLLLFFTLRDYAPWVLKQHRSKLRPLQVALYLSVVALPSALLL